RDPRRCCRRRPRGCSTSPPDAATRRRDRMMSSIEVAALAAALGAVMPLIVAVVVQSSWPRQLKASVALISCLLAGALAVLEAGLSPLDVALALPVLVATMEVSYRRYW